MEERAESNSLEKLRYMKGTIVEVYLMDGKVMKGKLLDIEPELLNLVLEDVDLGDRRVPKALISGAYVMAVFFTGLKHLKDIELKVLLILQKNPTISATEVARMINEKVGKVKSVMRKLERKGLLSA